MIGPSVRPNRKRHNMRNIHSMPCLSAQLLAVHCPQLVVCFRSTQGSTRYGSGGTTDSCKSRAGPCRDPEGSEERADGLDTVPRAAASPQCGPLYLDIVCPSVCVSSVHMRGEGDHAWAWAWAPSAEDCKTDSIVCLQEGDCLHGAAWPSLKMGS